MLNGGLPYSAAVAGRYPSRRQFMVAAACIAAQTELARGQTPDFRFRFILASCMYGYQPLSDILAEVPKTGAQAIDIWPMVHGNQREQIEALGEVAFEEMLAKHSVKLGCTTQYKLGPFGLKSELQFAQRFGCSTIVTGAQGPKGLSGSELKSAVAHFARQMQPHLQSAEEAGVTIAIENHGSSLIESPDSIRWLIDLASSERLAIALAPYHLPQDSAQLAQLILDIGDRMAVFYAWQHGMGCMHEQPKQQELLQMPGRGPLDFGPIVAALQKISYRGWTEIFMHPFPRGIPILEPTSAVTAEINRARHYLQSFLPQA